MSEPARFDCPDCGFRHTVGWRGCDAPRPPRPPAVASLDLAGILKAGLALWVLGSPFIALGWMLRGLLGGGR